MLHQLRSAHSTCGRNSLSRKSRGSWGFSDLRGSINSDSWLAGRERRRAETSWQPDWLVEQVGFEQRRSNRFRIDMPRLVEHYLKGRLHLDDWISARIKLSEVDEGFANMKAGRGAALSHHV